jgi:3',5'-cyclic AMP phosphodiesterase CpdA
MRFLHLSDVHVTQDYLQIPLRKLGWRRAVAMWELTIGGRQKRYSQSRRTIEQILEDGVRDHHVDHVIVSGDLTAYATRWEFEQVRAAFGNLCEDRSRFTVIPGNHDVYTPGAYNTRRFEQYFGHLLQSDLPEYTRDGGFPFVRLVGEGAAAIGLMSARVPPVPGLSFGVVGRKQLGALRDALHDERLRHRAILVAVHHAPVAPSGRRDHLFHGLLDSDQLLALLPGPRFAVLHGHIHKRYHHLATDQRPHTFGAGSSTEGGHEGYWIIEVRDGLVVGGRPHAPSSAPAAPIESAPEPRARSAIHPQA